MDYSIADKSLPPFMSLVPENIHTPPQRVIGNSEGEGVLKAKIFKGKFEPKLEFPEGLGGGFKAKKPSMGGIWIFSGTTQ